MPDSLSLLEKLLSWFREYARPALVATEKPEQIQQYDQQVDALSQLRDRHTELFPICVLGQARVGKSTLINTLVAETDIVVPSGGGDGPLTANALRVRYGDTKKFTVRYHGKQVINQTRFILEAKLKREIGKANGKATTPNETEVLTVVETDIIEEIKTYEQGSESDQKTATEEAVRRAKLLVTGSQSEERELAYLIDALCWVQGIQAKHNTNLNTEDTTRLCEVKKAVEFGSAKTSRSFSSDQTCDFIKQLHLHACGYLAPLIAEMKIEWPSPMLRDGLELIDLPGIGIHNDLYESVTARFLREEARAIMLITDSGGLRQNDADLLRDSGFLNRLLHSSDDPESDPVSLIVAVVKIDDVAVENWRNDKAANGGKAQRTKAEHFALVVDSLRANTARALKDFLTEAWRSEDEALQREKAAIIERLSNSVQVFPLSAPQYRLIMEQDVDDKPFLSSIESTQIPALRRAIMQVTIACHREREARLRGASARFFGQLRARMNLAAAQLSDEKRAQYDRDAMEAQLTEYLGPLQREFDTRRGAFRAYLRQTIPIQIDDKVSNASVIAQKEIYSYLNGLRGAHWSTLRAAVRRSGSYFGARHIQLPHDFALKFEEPVAQVWSTAILQGLRRETSSFSTYQADLLNEVLLWAKSSGIKVKIKLLEALVEDVQQQKKRLNAVGKEAIEELRATVRSQLLQKIEGPIRKRCEKFVKDGDDIGPGVKHRILNMFAELAEDAVAKAKTPATDLLNSRFKEVEKDIVTAFEEHSNPLEDAANALLQRFEHQLEHANRKAAETHSQLLAAVAAIPDQLGEFETDAA
ncbi:MAG: dynamin family protein [Verrucomicrobiota bacterium]|nr:dynamin family protein [Verrucomicrobiota bacterium]